MIVEALLGICFRETWLGCEILESYCSSTSLFVSIESKRCADYIYKGKAL